MCNLASSETYLLFSTESHQLAIDPPLHNLDSSKTYNLYFIEAP